MGHRLVWIIPLLLGVGWILDFCGFKAVGVEAIRLGAGRDKFLGGLLVRGFYGFDVARLVGRLAFNVVGFHGTPFPVAPPEPRTLGTNWRYKGLTSKGRRYL